MSAPAIILALSFLDPVSGVVAGAVAGAAVLTLYFLKLRRRVLRVSSTLLWERAVQDLQVNVPFRWIRASWLLFLQLLGVAALAAALARPVVESGWTPRGRILILIDRSASMSALDAPGAQTALGRDRAPSTRLAEAKRRAADLVNRLDLDSAAEAMVIEFGADARVAAGLSRNRSELLRAIGAVTPTDQPENLGAAFDLARAFAAPVPNADDPESGPPNPTTVVLFTDGAPFTPRPDSPDQPPPVPDAGAPVRVERVGPAPFRPDAPDAGADAAPGASGPDAPARRPGLDNLAITAFSVRRDADNPARARAFFRVQSSLAEPTDAPIVFFVNDQPARAVSVAVRAAPPGAIAEQGESILLDAPGESIVEARIQRDDLLASDNAAGVVLPPPGGPAVLLVAPKTEAGAPDPDAAVVHAIESLEGSRIRIIHADEYASLSPGALPIAEADLILFDRVEPGAPPPRPSLHFGAGSGAEGVRIRPALDPDAPPRASRILQWSRTSPVLRDLSLDAPLLAGEPALDLPDNAIPVAQGEAGPVIATLEARGRRRVFVAFDVARSTWWLTPGFAIFTANAVEWLSGYGAETVGRASLTSEPMLVAPAPGAERVRAAGPATIEALVPPSIAPGEIISLGIPERAGVYTLEGAAAGRRAHAVNLLDAAESALATSDGPFAAVGLASSRGGGAADTHGGREIWRWFALAAIVLLTVEWWLYAWRSRVDPGIVGSRGERPAVRPR